MSTIVRRSLIGLLIGLAACNTESTPQPSVTSVSVTPNTGSVAVGATFSLNAQVEVKGGASKAVSWSSSDTSKATVDNTGLVTGVAVGSATLTATSTVDNSKKGSATLTITPSTSNITGVSVSPNSATIPVNATQQFNATVSGTGSVSQSVQWTSSNTAVATIDDSGLVTAKSPGSTTITAAALADLSKKDSASLTVNAPGALSFGNYPSLIATVNQPIPTRTATISGGKPSYTFSVSPSTPLPAGLVLGSNGSISGTPTAPSPATNYTIQVADSAGATASATINITVNPAPTPTLTYITPKALTVGRPITGDNYGVSTNGLSGTLSYTVFSGSLPSGLSLNSSNGTLSGTPTNTGNFSAVIRVSDTGGATANGNLNLVVNAAPSFSGPYPPLTATVGVTFTGSQPTVTGGTTPFTFSASNLPAGLSVNPPSGAIVGVPSAPSDTTNYTVTVSDANGATANTTVSIKVNAALVLTYKLIRELTEDIPITPANYSLTTSGGAQPYTYSAEENELPTGMDLDARTGALSGSTTDTGDLEITITVTDANKATATSTFTLVVNPPLNVLTDYVNPPNLKVGVAFTSSAPVIEVKTGTKPYTYKAITTLPAGLSIDPSTGVISGTPQQASGTTDYAIEVKDANGDIEPLEINLEVDP